MHVITKEYSPPRRGKLSPLVQGTKYAITEWDDSVSVVKIRSVGGRVVRRCADGSPFLVRGGDVLMQYEDGLTHRVTARYFESLKPAPVVDWVD